MRATAMMTRRLPLVSALLAAARLMSLAAGGGDSWGRYRQVLTAQEPVKNYGVLSLTDSSLGSTAPPMWPESPLKAATTAVTGAPWPRIGFWRAW